MSSIIKTDFIPSQNRNNIYYAHNASHIFTPKKLLMGNNDDFFISYSDSKMIALSDLGETNSLRLTFKPGK